MWWNVYFVRISIIFCRISTNYLCIRYFSEHYYKPELLQKTHFLSSETKLDFSYKFHFEILLFEIRYGYQKMKIYN